MFKAITPSSDRFEKIREPRWSGAYVYNALVESRVNLASPLSSDHEIPMNFNYPVYTRAARCSRDFCHTAGFKSRQTTHLHTPRFSPFPSLFCISGGSLEGISRAERVQWKSASCFASSTTSLAACSLC